MLATGLTRDGAHAEDAAQLPHHEAPPGHQLSVHSGQAPPPLLPSQRRLRLAHPPATGSAEVPLNTHATAKGSCAAAFLKGQPRHSTGRRAPLASLEGLEGRGQHLAPKQRGAPGRGSLPSYPLGRLGRTLRALRRSHGLLPRRRCLPCLLLPLRLRRQRLSQPLLQRLALGLQGAQPRAQPRQGAHRLLRVRQVQQVGRRLPSKAWRLLWRGLLGPGSQRGGGVLCGGQGPKHEQQSE